MIIFLLCVILVLALLVPYFRQIFLFRQHGIKYFMPLPLVGNMGGILLRQSHTADDLLKLYKSFPEERWEIKIKLVLFLSLLWNNISNLRIFFRFVGRFEFTNAALVIRDVELAKKIAVKDFEHFLNHRKFGADSFFSRTLILMQGTFFVLKYFASLLGVLKSSNVSSD